LKENKDRRIGKKARGIQRTSFFHSIFIYRLRMTGILVESRKKKQQQIEKKKEMVGNLVY
jgi:hypothetical protein